MVKLIYATCRHCGHKFIPRVEYPRQCGNCWRLAPLGRPSTNEKNTDRKQEKVKQ